MEFRNVLGIIVFIQWLVVKSWDFLHGSCVWLESIIEKGKKEPFWESNQFPWTNKKGK